jgi:hypothetical protein
MLTCLSLCSFSSLYAIEQNYLPHFARGLAAVVLAAVWSAPRSALAMFARTETLTARKIVKSVGQAMVGTFALTTLSSVSDVAAEQLRTWTEAGPKTVTNNALFMYDFVHLVSFITCLFFVVSNETNRCWI